MKIVQVVLTCVLLLLREIIANDVDDNANAHYTIEGRIVMEPMLQTTNWQANTRIHVNGGKYLAFVKDDGTFQVHNMPPGSYIVEVLHSQLSYEPVRVEINSKGKIRARIVNHIQTALVVQVPYPLRMKPAHFTKYFHLREQWMITDFLFNPMILMMVLPLLLIMVLPKMMNDPDTKKELEQFGSMTKCDMPDVGDMVTNFLAGSTSPPTANNGQPKKSVRAKKRQ